MDHIHKDYFRYGAVGAVLVILRILGKEESNGNTNKQYKKKLIERFLFQHTNTFFFLSVWGSVLIDAFSFDVVVGSSLFSVSSPGNTITKYLILSFI